MDNFWRRESFAFHSEVSSNATEAIKVENLNAVKILLSKLLVEK